MTDLLGRTQHGVRPAHEFGDPRRLVLDAAVVVQEHPFAGLHQRPVVPALVRLPPDDQHAAPAQRRPLARHGGNRVRIFRRFAAEQAFDEALEPAGVRLQGGVPLGVARALGAVTRGSRAQLVDQCRLSGDRRPGGVEPRRQIRRTVSGGAIGIRRRIVGSNAVRTFASRIRAALCGERGRTYGRELGAAVRQLALPGARPLPGRIELGDQALAIVLVFGTERLELLAVAGHPAPQLGLPRAGAMLEHVHLTVDRVQQIEITPRLRGECPQGTADVTFLATLLPERAAARRVPLPGEQADVASVLLLQSLLDGASHRVLAILRGVHAGMVDLVVLELVVLEPALGGERSHLADIETGAEHEAVIPVVELPQLAAPDRRSRRAGRPTADRCLHRGNVDRACRWARRGIRREVERCHRRCLGQGREAPW